MGATTKKNISFVWPLGILLLVWFAFAFPYWGKGLVPFPSKYLVTFFAPWSNLYGMPVKNNAMPDVITQIYPWKHVTTESWKRGEVPLWNPYSFSGANHVGNYQSAIFSPINVLFFVIPEIHAWSMMILLQPILAGVFMYLFLRSLGMSAPASVLGSLAFMFCGFIVVWMAYGTLGYAVLFLPLILYGIQTKKYVLVAISTALSFLSGHFQMSLYVFLCSMAFGISIRQWKALLFLCFGLGIASPQLFPAYRAYLSAVRSSLFQKGEVIPWEYIPTLLAPDFYGNPVTRNDWFGHYAEWAGFIGVVPLLLSLLRPVRFWTIAAGFTLLLAYQTPLVDFLFAMKIPVLSTSSASRIIVLTSFSLAVLSGFGLDKLIELWKKKDVRKVVRWSGILLIVTVVFWIALFFLKPLPPDKFVVALRNSYLPMGLLLITIAIATVGFVVPKKIIVILPYILIFCTTIDVYRFAAKWMPFDPKEYVYPELPVISKLKELTKVDQSRIFGNIGNEVGSQFGLSLIEGYDAVYQKRYGEFVSSVDDGKIHLPERSVVMFPKKGKYSEEVLEFLGARYYLHKKSDGRFVWSYPFWEYPQYQLLWEDDNFQIFENKKSLPRAFLASSYRVETEDQRILDAFYTLDRKNQIILEKEPALKPEPGEGSAGIESYKPTEIVLHTQVESPKLLFVSDVYDSGWHVTVDGSLSELHRANFAFRAVEVPSGQHKIRMWYAPTDVLLGYWISALSLVTMIVVHIWKKRV